MLGEVSSVQGVAATSILYGILLFLSVTNSLPLNGSTGHTSHHDGQLTQKKSTSVLLNFSNITSGTTKYLSNDALEQITSTVSEEVLPWNSLSERLTVPLETSLVTLQGMPQGVPLAMPINMERTDDRAVVHPVKALSDDMVHYNIVPGVFDKHYAYNVSNSLEYLFAYTYNTSMLRRFAVRVQIRCVASEFLHPVIVVVRQQRGALSWQLPMQPPPGSTTMKAYTTVSRTMCPVQNFVISTPERNNGGGGGDRMDGGEQLVADGYVGNYSGRADNVTSEGGVKSSGDINSSSNRVNSAGGDHDSGGLSGTQRLFIDVSTLSPENKTVEHVLQFYHNFKMQLNEEETVSVSPSTPVYMFFSFPTQVTTVLVEARSDCDLCAVVAVQTTSCPVWDLEETVKYANLFQTMSKLAAITVTKAEYPHGFYIIVLTLSSDVRCSPMMSHYDPARLKTTTVLVTEKISSLQMGLGVTCGVAFCLVVYALVGAKVYADYRRHQKFLDWLGPSDGGSEWVVGRRRRRVVRRTTRRPGRRARQEQDQQQLLSAGTSENNSAFQIHEADADATQHLHGSAVAPREGAGAVTELAVVVGAEDPAPLITAVEATEATGGENNSTLASEQKQYKVVHDSDSSVCCDASRSVTEEDEEEEEGDDEEDVEEAASSAWGGDTMSRHSWDGGGGGGQVVGGQLRSGDGRRRQYGSGSDGGDNDDSIVGGGGACKTSATAAALSSSNTHAPVFVHVLSRKRALVLRRRSDRFCTTLFSCFIFYFIPVLQLVANYQTIVSKTGDEDVCYFNFLCAIPALGLNDFNHVFSNVGYLALGALFLLLTYCRQRAYQAEVSRAPHVEQLGIPRDFGLYYTMSTALIMEGLMSACYHVCPNRSNFQFDTVYMYVISVVCMVKLFQRRHSDIAPSADTVFCVLAVTVLLGVVGGLFSSMLFWIVATVMHLLLCCLVVTYVYYFGRWSLLRSLQRIYSLGGARYVCASMVREARNWRNWRRVNVHCGTRNALLAITSLANMGVMLAGLIVQPADYDSFLLYILVANLIIYFVYYVINKVIYGEHLEVHVKVALVACVSVWGAAVAVFTLRTTDWSGTPAHSRNLNQPCVVFSLLDWHDVWHFLSALALFTSFYLLLCIDDDIRYSPRDVIAVF